MDGSENKKELSEEDMEARYIAPVLNKSGWPSAVFQMDLLYRKIDLVSNE